MSQSSALTPEQKANGAKQRKDGILGAAFVSVLLLAIYIFTAQFVGIPGLLIFVLLLTLSWWSVLRKDAFKPKVTTPSQIASAMQTSAPPSEPTNAIASSPSPSGRLLTSATTPADKSRNVTSDRLRSTENIPASQQSQQPQSEFMQAMAVLDILHSAIREVQEEQEEHVKSQLS